ncbi:hypothetical protein [Shouchella miscanthi]|uniref:Uncharacterized protein n=1 Tax=Shouchella miscanthi TaxID=2598861 RepID=A0ABU6NNI3_9BACI|nr:hypothetical protein [Shouchella miscanthi]
MKKTLFSILTSVSLVAGMTATSVAQASSIQGNPTTQVNVQQQNVEPLEIEELEEGINKLIIDEDNYAIFHEKTDDVKVEFYENEELIFIAETSANSTEAVFKDASGSILNNEQLTQKFGEDEISAMGNTQPHPELPAGPHAPLGHATTYTHDTTNASSFAAIVAPALVAQYASNPVVVSTSIILGGLAAVWTANLPNNGAYVSANIGYYDFNWGGPILRHYEQDFATYSDSAMNNQINSGTWYTWHEVSA